MDRRVFMGALAGGLPSLPVLARAQGPATSVRIGYVTGSPAGAADLIGGFLDGLRALGYDEGRNLTLERRYDEAKTETLAGIFAQLIRLNLDVIVVVGPEPRLRAARQATTTIPIVMIAIDYDPIARGYVTSLAQPGGNITGLFVRQTERASRSLGLQLFPVELRHGSHDFAGAFKTVEHSRAEALLSSASPLLFIERTRITELAAKYRLPVIAPFRQFAEGGALLTYGVNLLEMNRHAATYVDKILKGAKPADLPIEQPTKFELVINAKTAKALGLTIPQSLLARADELIQ